jgi:hypothetical protein
VSEFLTVAELEARLRPSGYSEKGFLGPGESFEEVIERDAMALREMGISTEEIANAIRRVIDDTLQQHEQRLRRQLSKRPQEFEKSLSPERKDLHIPNLYQPESVPEFDLNHMPGIDQGYLVDPDLQVFFVQYRGFQECPWGCNTAEGSRDFLILNRVTGEYFTGPSLIVHLIREHHFFEGMETPYRIDPLKAARVLELAQ